MAHLHAREYTNSNGEAYEYTTMGKGSVMLNVDLILNVNQAFQNKKDHM
jgi:hypothetical protein